MEIVKNLEIEMSRIKTNPDTIRLITKESLEPLIQSLKECGQEEAITLWRKPSENTYTVIRGVRRYEAIKSMNADKISAHVIISEDDPRSALMWEILCSLRNA